MRSRDFETNIGQFVVYRCDRCGVCFTNPQPVSEDIGKLYEGRNTSGDFPVTSTSVGKLRRWRLAYELGKVERFRSNANLKVLDFGCGDGFFALLVAAARSDSTVTAVDFHSEPPPLIAAENRTNLTYQPLTRFLAEGNQERFDLISCRNVLEHVLRPHDFIESMSNRMQSGATLLIEVPNYDSLWRHVLGKYFFQLYLPRHLYHFTPESLERLVQKSGLEVSQLRKTHVPALGASLRYLTGIPFGNLGAMAMLLFPIQVLVDLVGCSSNNIVMLARKK
jgi:2-polyprenyl-3-methyl-5-hydroxy-6-metoxy-1,4-benzoquinol methylase